MQKKKVVIAMSAEEDSSVTAALLKEQGYECIGMHLNFWSDPGVPSEMAKHELGSCGSQVHASKGRGASVPAERGPSSWGKRSFPQNKCCTLGGLEDARDVCAKLDIPFYVMNVVSEFKERVVDYFLDSYAKGQTPNPCVECNRHIKFGELLKRADELGADFLASGHYAKVETNSSTGKRELSMPKDRGKDQTYFLYHLSQEKLERILFPLGGLMKSQVYELARKFGLIRVAEKPQSQGLCFFSEATPKEFLHRYLQGGFFRPGPMVTTLGKIIGQHNGLPLYTIGQRQGLGIGGIAGEPEGEPWYVVRIDPKQNQLVVGRKEDVYHDAFVCRDISFVSGEAPKKKMKVQVRIRHRGALMPATIELKRGKVLVFCDEPICAIAPGQAAVFYKGEEVIGGATIEKITSSRTHEKIQTSQKSRARVSVAY